MALLRVRGPIIVESGLVPLPGGPLVAEWPLIVTVLLAGLLGIGVVSLYAWWNITKRLADND